MRSMLVLSGQSESRRHAQSEPSPLIREFCPCPSNINHRLGRFASVFYLVINLTLCLQIHLDAVYARALSD